MKKIRDFKEIAISFGWIMGLLIMISMIWIFSQPLQTYYLSRTVNNVLKNNEDSRRLSVFLPQKHGKANLMGYWYSIQNSRDQMFVFTIFQDGILLPVGAVVSTDGNVEEMIPLSAHAVQVYKNIPESILQMYVRRIESAAFNREGNTR